MKVWLVLVILSKTAGVAGPLPNLDVCLALVEAYNIRITRSIAAEEAPSGTNRRNTYNYCIVRHAPPMIGGDEDLLPLPR